MTTTPTPSPPLTHPWDLLLLGPENALAHAAALALARAEPGAVSPLVLHGPSGSGKSRLLAGLVAERLQRNPGAAVAHLDAADLLTDTELDLHHVELLAIDNLTALDRAPARLRALGSLLDTLDAHGTAVALTLAIPPAHWPARWPARLTSRLRGGLILPVDPPGDALRRRYTLDRARTLGLTLDPDTLDDLTARPTGFRELDGRLARLALRARLGESAAQLIDDEDETNPPARLTTNATDAAIAAIARQVARQFRVTLTDLRGPARHAALVTPRHLAIHLARQHTGASFARLGRYFGRRDTKTIRHACQSASKRLRNDPGLAAAIHIPSSEDRGAIP